jgi:RNA polymerase sigma-70 factor (ECF subfamily)
MFTATLDVPPADSAHHREETIALGRTDDIDLVQLIRTGDQFREVAERHHSRILRVLYGILNHRDDAEDVAQDVFVEVYFSIRQSDHRSSLLTWIYCIAVNEDYSHLRKKCARRHCEVDSRGDRPLPISISSSTVPDRATPQRDSVNKLLALISPADLLLLLWREVEGCFRHGIGRNDQNEREHRRDKLFRARRKLVELATHLSRSPQQTGRSCRAVGFDQDRA